MLLKKATRPLKAYHKWTKWNIKTFPYTNPETLNSQNYIKVTMNTNKVNCFSPEFMSDLNGALDVLEKDFEPHLPVMLTADHVFSGGVDLKHITSLKTEEEVRTYFVQFNNSVERLWLLNRPTCAALYGPALAGGLILAFACDYRVVDQSDHKSRMGLRGAKLGLVYPSVGWEIIKSACNGPHPLYELVSRGDEYTMEEAFEETLVTAIADDRDDVERVACDLLANTSTEKNHAPFAYMKRLLKEPSLIKARKDGSAMIRDNALVKQVLNPDVHEKIVGYIKENFHLHE
jgi:enoyl-CoA hydratase